MQKKACGVDKERRNEGEGERRGGSSRREMERCGKIGTNPKYLPQRNTKTQCLHFYSDTINRCQVLFA